jgi:transcriptional regulator with XRE-family HTH domain
MTQVARDAGLSRESLYRALSGEGNPEFGTILKVVKALGLKLPRHRLFMARSISYPGRYRSLRPTPKNQRSINPAKREIIVHHVLITHLPKLAAQVIKLAALRIDVVEVEGVGV